MNCSQRAPKHGVPCSCSVCLEKAGLLFLAIAESLMQGHSSTVVGVSEAAPGAGQEI